MIDAAVEQFLRAHGLIDKLADATFSTLTGGVASDIWKVETADRCFVVKKALPTLRVAQHWSAPVSRNASEVDWMTEAARIVPDAVPHVIAHDSKLGMFAMTYFDPKTHRIWKDELRVGRAEPGYATQLGGTLGQIHRATAGDPNVARRFATDATFHAIRIEPYIGATARVHRDLADILLRLGQDTLTTKRSLVHGDVSPKNILIGPNGPVLLDAECAWFGDPAFDLAFCLNHLLLKCLWRPVSSVAFLACFDAMAKAYLSMVDWEPVHEIEARAARLLPVLLLARVDGKSPVEYIIRDDQKDYVRQFARAHILTPRLRLADIRQAWVKEYSA